jgi:hypothetical protein
MLQATVLALELVFPTLPAGKTIPIDFTRVSEPRKNPIVIKEGVKHR